MIGTENRANSQVMNTKPAVTVQPRGFNGMSVIKNKGEETNSQWKHPFFLYSRSNHSGKLKVHWQIREVYLTRLKFWRYLQIYKTDS